MVYFVSDMFFGNIDVAKRRHFSSSSEMDSLIVSNWNKVVTSNDTVYILGGVGSFDYMSILAGEKILIMSEYERDHFLSYVNSISSNRDDDYDYEMYESYLEFEYGIKSLIKSGRVIKKNYTGRVIRLTTDYIKFRDLIPSIIGATNEYQRVFSDGVNSNIFLNGYYPISDLEVEELLRNKGNLL